MGTWSPRLIPRKTLNAKRVTGGVDADGYPIDDVDVAFTVENASVQPVTGYSLQAVPEGYRDNRVVRVYTTTEVLIGDEGTDLKGDQIEFEPGRWGRVVKVEPWQVGVQSHYLAFVVEVNER